MSSTYLTMGYNATGSGTYNLVGGTCNNSGGVYVGFTGNGTLNQSGGVLTSTYGEAIGFSLSGTLNQTGGSTTIGTVKAGALQLGIGSLSTGNYLLSNTGSLTVNGTEYIGELGQGTLNQSGGTHTIGSAAAAGRRSRGPVAPEPTCLAAQVRCW